MARKKNKSENGVSVVGGSRDDVKRDEEFKKQQDEMDSQRDAETIMKAHEVMSVPEKMKKVRDWMKNQKRKFKSIDDLKAYANEKYGPKSSESDDSEDGSFFSEEDKEAFKQMRIDQKEMREERKKERGGE